MSSHTGFSRGIIRAVFAAIVAATVGVPASFAQNAADKSHMRSVTVQYSDLDIATAEGSRILYHRLVDAAERVCPQVGRPADLRLYPAARSCINAAVQDAVKQIRNPQLAQMAAARMR
jgi:UrcA family protein